MPWTLQNPPPPAKNWSEAQKRRCVAAANAVLTETGDERKAVFACIHAAGKSQRKQDGYSLAGYDAEQAFKYLLGLYLIHRLTRNDFEAQFTAALEDHFGRLMLLALGRPPTSQELVWLNSRIQQEQNQYLQGFFEDINSGRYSEDRLLWRAGQYAWARDVYVRYTIPFDAAALMPFLPGEDCLGRDRCRCWLTVNETEDTYEVTWHLDPGSHTCEVCQAHAASSPYVFPKEI